MVKSKIEWCDYTINPVKGLCPMACPYCYARRMYKRFKWNPEIRLDKTGFPSLPEKPSMVFVGSTMELFGSWIPDDWWYYIENSVENHYKQHTFIFLTKLPQNLPKRFPDNCWVGVSATNYWAYVDACNYLSLVNAKIKFISIEPLLSWDKKPQFFFNSCGINWLIIGQQTPVSPKTLPNIEWIRGIVEAADKADIPVFLKNNLNSCEIADYPELINKNSGNLRQEFPNKNIRRF